MAAHPNRSNISPSKEASQLDCLRRQFRVSPPGVSPADADLKGKTAIITGGNSGLGFYSGAELLSLGLSRLVITARGEAKVAFRTNQSTQHEDIFQVNYLSNALLTILLLPVLKAKKLKRRLESSGSTRRRPPGQNSKRNSTPLFAALDKKPSNFDFLERYYTSKLLCQLFITELTKRVTPSVAVITGISGGILAVVKRMIGRSPPVGARTLTDAAVKHGEEVPGQYLGDCKLKPMAPLVYEPESAKLAQQLWGETMTELALFKAPKIVAELKDSLDHDAVVERDGPVQGRLQARPEADHAGNAPIMVKPSIYKAIFYPAKVYLLKFVFLGRSDYDKPSAKTMVSRMESMGASVTVKVVRSDVSKAADVTAAAKTCQTIGVIGGVVQAAMGLHEALFQHMSNEAWHTIIQPKWAGTWNLHNALAVDGRDKQLDFFHLTSSVSGSVGTATESNYCAANLTAFLTPLRDSGASKASQLCQSVWG
ncbi:hypothetical protein DL765_007632 [Monosporascus sp. GIB2]|nr:hypothetical protein DL765_007632 [Monosporascus sp. GIB2]